MRQANPIFAIFSLVLFATAGLVAYSTSAAAADPEGQQQPAKEKAPTVTAPNQQQLMELMKNLQESGDLPAGVDLRALMLEQPGADGAETASTRSSQAQNSPPPAEEYESEYCRELHKRNADKKITDAQSRDPFSGQYAEPTDTKQLQSWNVETVCKEFLVAIPMWADVAPIVMLPAGESRFTDVGDGSWIFQLDADGKAKSVTRTSPTGIIKQLVRTGDPYKF